VQGFSWNGGNGKGKWQGCSALQYDPGLFGRLWSTTEVQRAARDGNLALAVALPEPYGVVDIDARGVEELPRDAYDRRELQRELERVAFDVLGIPPTAPRVMSGRGLHCYVRGDYDTLSRAVAQHRGQLKVRLSVQGRLHVFDVGVELKGWGRGYVLAPPSRHHSGCSYEWLTEVPTREAIPEWQPKPDTGGQDRAAVTIVDERGRWLADPFALPVAPQAPAEAHKLSQEAIREATKLLLERWTGGVGIGLRSTLRALALNRATRRSRLPTLCAPSPNGRATTS
jgi:hypothetical protein